MKLYYAKNRYAADNSLAIRAYAIDEEFGFLEPYGNVTVCLVDYGRTPDEGHIYMPTYKMTPEFRAQVLRDIAQEVVEVVPIGYGEGLYVWLKPDWEQNVDMVDWM